MSPEALITVALEGPLPGQVHASDRFADAGDRHAFAPVCVALLDHHDPRVVRLAVHLGTGVEFADALLTAIEAGTIPPESREDAMQALICDDIAHDHMRNARAGIALAEAGRYDLMMCVLGRADPHHMMLDAFEQVVRRPPVDAHLIALAAAAIAVDRPSELPRAAAFIRNVRGQHALFIEAAREAAPGLLPSILADIRATFTR